MVFPVIKITIVGFTVNRVNFHNFPMNEFIFTASSVNLVQFRGFSLNEIKFDAFSSIELIPIGFRSTSLFFMEFLLRLTCFHGFLFTFRGLPFFKEFIFRVSTRINLKSVQMIFLSTKLVSLCFSFD